MIKKIITILLFILVTPASAYLLVENGTTIRASNDTNINYTINGYDILKTFSLPENTSGSHMIQYQYKGGLLETLAIIKKNVSGTPVTIASTNTNLVTFFTTEQVYHIGVVNTTDIIELWGKCYTYGEGTCQFRGFNMTYDYTPAPAIIYPSNNSVKTTSSINITWNSTGLFQYQVSSIGDFSTQIFNQTTTNAYSGNLQLPTGLNYIRVKIYNSDTETNWSNTQQVYVYPSPVGYRIFSFDDLSKSGWNDSLDRMDVTNGDVRIDGSAGSTLVLSNNSYTANDIVFDYIPLNIDYGSYGIIFNAQNSSFFYHIRYNHGSNAWQIYRFADGLLKNQIAFTGVINTVYRGRIILNSTSNSTFILSHINGTMIFTLSFDAYSEGWCCSGYLGIREGSLGNKVAIIDNIGINTTLSYSDDFSSDTSSKYTNTGQALSITNGGYAFNDSTKTYTTYMNQNYTTYHVTSVDFNVSNMAQDKFVRFDIGYQRPSFSETNNMYLFELYNRTTGYNFNLSSRVDGTTTLLDTTIISFSQNFTYTLKVKQSPDGYVLGKIWQKGTVEPAWQVVSLTQYPKITEGFVRLAAYQSIGYFDNLSISSDSTNADIDGDCSVVNGDIYAFSTSSNSSSLKSCLDDKYILGQSYLTQSGTTFIYNTNLIYNGSGWFNFSEPTQINGNYYFNLTSKHSINGATFTRSGDVYNPYIDISGTIFNASNNIFNRVFIKDHVNSSQFINNVIYLAPMNYSTELWFSKPGIELIDADDVLIYDNIFEGNSTIFNKANATIAMYSTICCSDNVNVSFNDFKNISSTTVVPYNVTNWKINNNYFLNSYEPISTQYFNNSRIENNRIEFSILQMGEDEILLGAYSMNNVIKNNTIVGNYINNAGNGIWIYWGSSNNTLESNYVDAWSFMQGIDPMSLAARNQIKWDYVFSGAGLQPFNNYVVNPVLKNDVGMFGMYYNTGDNTEIEYTDGSLFKENSINDTTLSGRSSKLVSNAVEAVRIQNCGITANSATTTQYNVSYCDFSFLNKSEFNIYTSAASNNISYVVNVTYPNIDYTVNISGLSQTTYTSNSTGFIAFSESNYTQNRTFVIEAVGNPMIVGYGGKSLLNYNISYDNVTSIYYDDDDFWNKEYNKENFVVGYKHNYSFNVNKSSEWTFDNTTAVTWDTANGAMVISSPTKGYITDSAFTNGWIEIVYKQSNLDGMGSMLFDYINDTSNFYYAGIENSTYYWNANYELRFSNGTMITTSSIGAMPRSSVNDIYRLRVNITGSECQLWHSFGSDMVYGSQCGSSPLVRTPGKVGINFSGLGTMTIYDFNVWGDEMPVYGNLTYTSTGKIQNMKWLGTGSIDLYRKSGNDFVLVQAASTSNTYYSMGNASIVRIKENDNITRINSLLFAEDTTPPASISNLQSTTGTTWINWTWINPLDTDFNVTQIYIDGIYNISSSLIYFNLTDLVSGSEHTISTHTIDLSGNINTSWVNQTTTTSIAIFTPPTPTTLSNTTGNFWVNYTWSAGSGNVTNSYNVSQNNTWSNGSLTQFINTTLLPHGWSNVSVYAYNTSGSGTLNTTPASQNTQLSNNAPILSSIGNKSIDENQWLNFTISATDLDSDTLTYNSNTSYFNTTTKNFNYSTNYTSSGIYVWYFNVTDVNGSIDTETITVAVTNVPLTITYLPSSNPSTTNGTAQTFNVTSNRTSNMSWYYNTSLSQSNTSATIANYSNTTLNDIVGIHNITVGATDGIDTVSTQWNWTVTSVAPTPTPTPTPPPSSGGGGGGGGNYIVNNYNVVTSNNPPLLNITGSGLNWNINIQNEGNASQEYIINWQLRNSLGIIIDHGTTSKQLLPDEIYSLPIILSTFLPLGGYTIKVNVQYGIYISEANQFFSVGTIYSNDEIIIALLILSGIFLLSIYSRNTKK